MNRKIAIASVILILAGLIQIGLTVYQERVQEPQWPEDYHMGIPTAKYEWRSRSILITWLGVLCIIWGILGIIISWRLKP